MRCTHGSDDISIKWDNQLATLAQEHTNKIVKDGKISHSIEHYKLYYAGENVGFDTNGIIDNESKRGILYKWYNQLNNYDFKNNKCKDNLVCSNFTNMIWNIPKYKISLGCGCGKLGPQSVHAEDVVDKENLVAYTCLYKMNNALDDTTPNYNILK